MPEDLHELDRLDDFEAEQLQLDAAHRDTPRQAGAPAAPTRAVRTLRIPPWAVLGLAVVLWFSARWVGHVAVSRPETDQATRSSTRTQREPGAVALNGVARSSPSAPTLGAAPDPTLIQLDLPQRAVYSPSFSSDGSSVLFHAEDRSRSSLMRATVAADGRAGTPVTLLDDGAKNFHVRLSPNRRRIAFDSDRDGTRGVYLANADGTQIRRVSGPTYAAVPSWSPDGEHVAFVQGTVARPAVWNVWVLDTSSNARHPISAFTRGQVWTGSWFPDSGRLCYSHDTELFVTDINGRQTRRYSTPVAGRAVRTPAVSPDGHRIAFQVFRDGIWTLDLRDGSMHRLLADRSAEEFAWSPDGSRLAFHSNRDGAWRLWMMPVGPNPKSATVR
jgi:Tol biopolymer transport system component